jgi:hypothetical protein
MMTNYFASFLKKFGFTLLSGEKAFGVDQRFFTLFLQIFHIQTFVLQNISLLQPILV